MSSQHNIRMPSILKGDDIFSSFNQIQKSIQERAYNIFHDRDTDSGDALTDWLKAESEVLTDVNMTLKDKKDQVVIEGKIDKFLPVRRPLPTVAVRPDVPRRGAGDDGDRTRV